MDWQHFLFIMWVVIISYTAVIFWIDREF